jgi:hypothetical protein
LERDPVAVAAGQLDDRLDPFLSDKQRGRRAAHAHDAPGAVGQVHGVDRPPQKAGLLPHRLTPRVARRVNFRRDHEAARLKAAGEPARRPLHSTFVELSSSHASTLLNLLNPKWAGGTALSRRIRPA